MTLCSSFFNASTSGEQRSRILIHEGSHGTMGTIHRLNGTEDAAYGYERLSRVMPENEALNNADSFALLVMSLNGDIRVPDQNPPADTGSALNSPAAQSNGEADMVRMAIARLQKWVGMGRSEASGVYSEIHQYLQRPAATRGNLPAGPNQELLQIIHTNFGLTRSPDPTQTPTETHKEEVAAIRWRYTLMKATFSNALTINRVTSGDATWSGTTVEVGPGFFSLATGQTASSPGKVTPAQVRLLLSKLAAQTAGVGAGARQAYVDTADTFRTRRGLGP
jgi:hypothetical protein